MLEENLGNINKLSYLYYENNKDEILDVIKKTTSKKYSIESLNFILNFCPLLTKISSKKEQEELAVRITIYITENLKEISKTNNYIKTYIPRLLEIQKYTPLEIKNTVYTTLNNIINPILHLTSEEEISRKNYNTLLNNPPYNLIKDNKINLEGIDLYDFFMPQILALNLEKEIGDNIPRLKGDISKNEITEELCKELGTSRENIELTNNRIKNLITAITASILYQYSNYSDNITIHDLDNYISFINYMGGYTDGKKDPLASKMLYDLTELDVGAFGKEELFQRIFAASYFATDPEIIRKLRECKGKTAKETEENIAEFANNTLFEEYKKFKISKREVVDEEVNEEFSSLRNNFDILSIFRAGNLNSYDGKVQKEFDNTFFDYDIAFMEENGYEFSEEIDGKITVKSDLGDEFNLTKTKIIINGEETDAYTTKGKIVGKKKIVTDKSQMSVLGGANEAGMKSYTPTDEKVLICENPLYSKNTLFNPILKYLLARRYPLVTQDVLSKSIDFRPADINGIPYAEINFKPVKEKITLSNFKKTLKNVIKGTFSIVKSKTKDNSIVFTVSENIYYNDAKKQNLTENDYDNVFSQILPEKDFLNYTHKDIQNILLSLDKKLKKDKTYPKNFNYKHAMGPDQDAALLMPRFDVLEQVKEIDKIINTPLFYDVLNNNEMLNNELRIIKKQGARDYFYIKAALTKKQPKLKHYLKTNPNILNLFNKATLIEEQPELKHYLKANPNILNLFNNETIDFVSDDNLKNITSDLFPLILQKIKISDFYENMELFYDSAYDNSFYNKSPPMFTKRKIIAEINNKKYDTLLQQINEEKVKLKPEKLNFKNKGFKEKLINAIKEIVLNNKNLTKKYVKNGFIQLKKTKDTKIFLEKNKQDAAYQKEKQAFALKLKKQTAKNTFKNGFGTGLPHENFILGAAKVLEHFGEWTGRKEGCQTIIELRFNDCFCIPQKSGGYKRISDPYSFVFEIINLINSGYLIPINIELKEEVETFITKTIKLNPEQIKTLQQGITYTDPSCAKEWDKIDLKTRKEAEFSKYVMNREIKHQFNKKTHNMDEKASDQLIDGNTLNELMLNGSKEHEEQLINVMSDELKGFLIERPFALSPFAANLLKGKKEIISTTKEVTKNKSKELENHI